MISMKSTITDYHLDKSWCMQAKVGHGEEEEGGMGDYSNALLGAGHQPLHELETPCLDLLLLFSEVRAPQLILFCVNLQLIINNNLQAL